MNKYQRALDFAAKKHKGQFRIGGADYITHPISVAKIVRDHGFNEDYQITALFHDLLEDTDTSEEEILEYGNEDILKAVKLLTKKEGYVMSEYIAGIKQNHMAFVVKSADRLHNLIDAQIADSAFKIKYIEETKTWYMDFSPEIREALEKLQNSVLSQTD